MMYWYKYFIKWTKNSQDLQFTHVTNVHCMHCLCKKKINQKTYRHYTLILPLSDILLEHVPASNSKSCKLAHLIHTRHTIYFQFHYLFPILKAQHCISHLQAVCTEYQLYTPVVTFHSLILHTHQVPFCLL